jgi:hypothetical protein
MTGPLLLPIDATPLPCRAEPHMWFDPLHYPAAIAACSRCPVLAGCRSMGRAERWGVWGGIPRDGSRPA